jgi:septum formation protein
MRLVLASASPRRAELLTAAGFAFDILPVDVDERALPGEVPFDHVGRLAAEKSSRAMAVLRGRGPADAVVLAADTVVAVDGRILGKPRDDDEARDMLRRLSGRSHQVLTGVSVRSVQPGGDDREVSGVETTDVWVASLSPEEIDWYVATGEGRDKAGGYAIQGLASRFIPRIEGSYSNVVGLPVAMVHDLLSRLARSCLPRS